jgi:hypothetical protein
VSLLLLYGSLVESKKELRCNLVTTGMTLRSRSDGLQTDLRTLSDAGLLTYRIDGEDVVFSITNWAKYQGLPERVEEKKKREEEKRREESPAEPKSSAPISDPVRLYAQTTFEKLTGLEPMKRSKEAGELWWAPLREYCQLGKGDTDTIGNLIKQTVAEMKSAGLTISSPKSTIKTARAIAGEWAVKAETPRADWKDGEWPGLQNMGS